MAVGCVLVFAPAKSCGFTASEAGGKLVSSAPGPVFGVLPMTRSIVPPLAMTACRK